jgi:hypothetical protein
VIPGRAKPRRLLPWLPYPESDRVLINSHNFLTTPPTIGFGDELLILRGPSGVTDQSGNGNDATYNGGMGVTADTGSGGVSAFSFDASNDFMLIPATVIQSLVESAGSIGFWAKPSSTTTTARTPFATDGGWRLQTFNRTAGFTFQTAAGPNGTRSLVVTALAANVWSHVVLTVTNATMEIFVNGVLAASGTATGNETYSSQTNNIGQCPGGSQRWAGLIDDFRVADRVWTPTEISDWHAAGRGYDT